MPDTQTRRPLAGSLAVLAAVSVWGAVAVVARLVDSIDGIALGFHRLWIGAVATVAVYLATGGRLSRRLLVAATPGGLAFALDIVLFFSALKHTTIANATIVGALQPALVLLIAGPLFGERPTAAIAAWTAVAIGGVALVVYGSSGAPVWSPLGDLLAVGALFAWTGYFVASKQARREVAAFDYLAAMMIVATLAVAPIAVLAGQRLLPDGPDEWAWIALLAIGSGGVGHLIINWAHDHIDLTVMSLLTLGVPVVAVISAALFVGEAVEAVQVLGMAVVLAALAVVVLRTSSTVPVTEPPAETVVETT